MESIPNLNPSTNKEWFMHLSTKIERLEESQVEYTDTLADFMKEVREWKKCKDEKDTTYYERVDNIDNRVKGWNVINSIGVVLASVLAFFGLTK